MNRIAIVAGTDGSDIYISTDHVTAVRPSGDGRTLIYAGGHVHETVRALGDVLRLIWPGGEEQPENPA